MPSEVKQNMGKIKKKIESSDYSKILEECAKIAEERQGQYGSAVESVRLACNIFNDTFGIKLSVKEFCMAMVSLKLSRLKFKYKEDSMIDCVNYIAIAIASERLNN